MKMDNKRFKLMLGLNYEGSTNYFASSNKSSTVKRCVNTQTTTQDFTQFDYLLQSPQIIKKVKVVAESTIHTYEDDLYCYESIQNIESAPITFQTKSSPIPIQKEFYNINPLYLQEYNEKEYNYKTRAIILNRIQDNCQNLNNSYSHKAIYLYDLFLSRLQSKSITNQTQLRFLSLAMIFVATKMNAETPNINSLLSQSSLNMTKQQLIQYERLILKVLDWHTNPLTLQDIIHEIIYRFYIAFPDFQTQQDQKTKTINQIVNSIVLDHHYLSYSLEDLSFSIVTVLFTKDLQDEQFEDFLKTHDKSKHKIQQAVKFVSKYIRVINQLNEKQLDINSLEILKLVCD
ncbi:unnamed protein product (macronuclear) [Paramecium tetraurelia]|uniref:Cyclin N-terminal domain-containing protein n=1 Tax=Paramecium tetraurelia TaxID=5888 RepID=A0BKW6_PARTE|nr:uncharacterized protein GSPATT00029814001 [Paramecium tetraurelia]CAK59183.1 unnamed protein product [Paramecium tetraurelia]|eukprot:XP_001426581.1 hypothetical protein (macronuclear) [Paramecium tetraurelia strain d4-2]